MLLGLAFLSWTILTVAGQDDDGFTDENRPYKFGFNIQGYQHRKEEKDTKGIIKGEYGFITADGYYRVTVYATDENGDFKIISMKNYYVGFPPEDPTTTRGPGNSQQKAGKKFSTESPKKVDVGRSNVACSSCLLPPTSPPSSANLPNSSTSPPSAGQFPNRAIIAPSNGIFPNTAKSPPSNGNFPNLSTSPPSSGNFPNSATSPPSNGKFPNYPTSPQSNGKFPNSPSNGIFPNTATGPPSTSKQFNSLRTNPPSIVNNLNSRTPSIGSVFNSPTTLPSIGINSQTLAPSIGSVFNSPTTPSSIGINSQALTPSIGDLEKNKLLYRFNYTVGFHGHHEDGYRNGDKIGDYFVNNRDGIGRKVEYVANEFGYQPNITLVDLKGRRVPEEKSEREYGLEGYEFKWFNKK